MARGVGASAAGGVDDADAAGEDEGPAHLQVVVLEELWPAVAEVALPHGIVVDVGTPGIKARQIQTFI
jgi:hypothetical protein